MVLIIEMERDSKNPTPTIDIEPKKKHNVSLAERYVFLTEAVGFEPTSP
jgi:hypothetical protein